MEKSINKIPIGISSCLLGNNVRYDGGHKYDRLIVDTLNKEFELIGFCPEVEIGLGVPRPKIQLVNFNQETRCLDELTNQIDYTDQLAQCYDQNQSWLTSISGYIFKTKSPSCGLSKVTTKYLHKETENHILKSDGRGIFARTLVERIPGLPVIEEDEFEQAERRQQFLLDVVKYFQSSNTSLNR
ncbi:DUF523 domain-containing protein [Aliikangiella coralliicola]|uniref:DUF523 domain-containing protein n=1 Tax=Aliikangiella coralliicola TaxID=2592383 RepID=A0A545UG06_9GAMM|nr:DUF523 domain-containing protein [Aliikangiella coralliicola]TQV88414.1 DUF523 domain-containing protein [Aliikangiella coralliicola]